MGLGLIASDMPWTWWLFADGLLVVFAALLALLAGAWLRPARAALAAVAVAVLLALVLPTFHRGLERQWDAKQERLHERDECIRRGGQPIYSYYRGEPQRYLHCVAKA